ncbi:MAG: hypothetical protein RIR97_602 [Pseudomonadota bacterium]
MTNRLHGLDILRLLMALLVLLFHFGFRGAANGDMPVLDIPLWLAEASRYGYLGVSGFFMISGFVIAYSAEGRTALEFAIARFARIYPTFLLCMTVTFLFESWAGTPKIFASFTDYLANIALVSPALGHPFMDGAYWSIVLEVIFYGWVFVLMLTGLFQSQKLPILIIWLLISVLNQSLFHFRILEVLFITKYSGFFIAGIVMYELRKNSSPAKWGVFLLSMMLALYTSYQELVGLENEFQIALSTWLLTLIVLLLPVVLFAFLSFKVPVRFVFLASFAGGLSYPLYLVHQHIGYVIFYHLGQGNLQTLMIVMVGLFILASIIYLLFDRHAVTWVRTILMGWLVQGLLYRRLARHDKTNAVLAAE